MPTIEGGRPTSRPFFLQEATLDFDSFIAIGRLAETAVAVIFPVAVFFLVWAIYRKLADAVVLLQFIRDQIHKKENIR